MGFREVLWAEWMAFYRDLMRRKSLVVSMLIYPYLLTVLFLVMGLAIGGISSFAARFHVSPIVFFVTMSHLMLTILIGTDTITQRPASDMWAGTLPYIIISPLPRLWKYFAVALPPIAPFALQGLVCLLPVYAYYYGYEGVLVALAIIAATLTASLLIIPVAMIVAGISYTVSEEGWRIVNIVRPLLLILLGVYYPRYLLPLVFRLATMIIPSSNMVELVQLILVNSLTTSTASMLIGLSIAVFVILLPLGSKMISSWEERIRVRGVKEY